MYRGMKDDIIRATQGLKKSHMTNEKLIVGVGMPVIVALITLAALYTVASDKGYVNAAIPAIMLCSLPVLVAAPVSAFAALKYANTVYGKASEGDDDAMFMKHADTDFDFTFVRPVSAPVDNENNRDEAPKIVININGSDAQPQSTDESASGENINIDATAENDNTGAEHGEAAQASENSASDDAQTSASSDNTDNTQTERRTQRIELDIGDDYIPIKRNVRTEED
jgi:hypothetical protein